MPKRTMIIVAAAVVVAAVAAAAYTLRETEEGAFTAHCVEAIKERLQAPATFELVEVELLTREPATYETMWGLESPSKHVFHMMQPAEMRAAYAALKPEDYDVILAFFHYDASNSAGVPIRELAKCSVRVGKGDEYGANPLTDAEVMIDGFTYGDWLQAEISRLSQ